MSFPPAVASVLAGRVPALGPGSPNAAARAAIEAIAGQVSPEVLAAVWLYHDFLDESHEISQEIHTPTGSLLHGIMHRREPDAWNSKYWFRQVGTHPVYASIGAAAKELGYGNGAWDAMRFVDDCEAARGKGGDREELLIRVQAKEIELIALWCATDL
jgi:type IV secretory pathway TrbL component